MKQTLSLISFAFLLASGCGSSTDDGQNVTDFGGIDFCYADCGSVAPEAGEGDAAGQDGESDVPSVVPAVENPELVLKITGPSGNGYASVPGAQVSLSGLVFGRFNTIAYINEATGSSGEASSSPPYWQTDSIPLVAGINKIRVTAQGDEEMAEEAIFITYNPGFFFPYPVEAKPNVLFQGEKQVVHVTVTLGPFGNMTGQSLELQQVDANGTVVAQLGNMVDDGAVQSSGDEVQGDGVYTWQPSITCQGPGPVYLRVGAQTRDFSGAQYRAYSAPLAVDCVPRLSQEACMAHQSTLKAARQAYDAAIGNGVQAARQAAIEAFKADPSVQESSSVGDTDGLWVAFNDGVLGALNIPTPGMRGPSDGAEGVITSALIDGSIAPLTKDTLLLSPFISEYGADDEIQVFGQIAAAKACPAFAVRGPYNNQAANLSRFRGMSHNGIVAISTHGGVFFKGLSKEAKERMRWSHKGAQEVLWTGEPVNCTALTKKTVTCQSNSQCPTGTECVIMQASYSGGSASASGVCVDSTQADIMSGRVVMGDATYGITPAFVLKHGSDEKYPQSLVYLGACSSFYNMTMASAFFATGAKTILGYTGPVTNEFATKTGGEFLANMVENAMKAGAAYGIGAQDPANPGSFFRILGARDLTISNSGILNESFETGDLTAWERDGDGRVITKLGTAAPANGKFMAIISTGLGFTTETGSIEQTFCIPAGTTTFSFFWKYYSEEFNEWCCSEFQDTFKATFTDEKGGKEYKIVDLAVDDLCKPDCFGQCTNWGCTLGKHYVGLKKSDVSFDMQDAWKTDWQKAVFDISKIKLAGNVPVTLRFFATDKGDSIYDTAVLVDGLKFE